MLQKSCLKSLFEYFVCHCLFKHLYALRQEGIFQVNPPHSDLQGTEKLELERYYVCVGISSRFISFVSLKLQLSLSSTFLFLILQCVYALLCHVFFFYLNPGGLLILLKCRIVCFIFPTTAISYIFVSLQFSQMSVTSAVTKASVSTK